MSTITEIELIKAYVRERFGQQSGAQGGKAADLGNGGSGSTKASTEADTEAVEVVGVNKHRKLRKADLQKFEKLKEEGNTAHISAKLGGSNQVDSQAMKDVYRVWSAFTKTLRAVVLKHIDDDLVIKTVFMGKFYVSKLDKTAAIATK